MIYYKVALTKLLEQVGLIIFVVVILKTDLAVLISLIGLDKNDAHINSMALSFIEMKFRLEEAVFHIYKWNYSKINSMWYWSFTFVKDFQNMYLLHCISTVILMLSDFSFFSTPIIDIWSVILWYEVQVKRIVRPARVKL